MSRIRRRIQHTDVHVELGDPLPLPYKIKDSSGDSNANIKTEDDEETAVDHKSYEPILLKTQDEINPRTHKNILRNRIISNPKITDSETNIRPIDLRKSYIGINRPDRIRRENLENQISLSNKVNNNKNPAIDDIRKCLNEFESLIYQSQNIQQEVLDEMQKNLWTIYHKTKKKITELESFYNEDASYFESLDQAPTSNELLDELDRLQNMKTESSNRLQFSSTTVSIILGLLALFLLTSFMVSGLNYAYCYNNCEN